MTSNPLFPNLKPQLVDSMWFDVDEPCDDEAEVSQLEAQHQSWLQSISQRDQNLTPIGKTVCENLEDDDEEDEDDNDDEDDSESHDEEDEDDGEMDVSQEPDV